MPPLTGRLCRQTQAASLGQILIVLNRWDATANDRRSIPLKSRTYVDVAAGDKRPPSGRLSGCAPLYGRTMVLSLGRLRGTGRPRSIQIVASRRGGGAIAISLAHTLESLTCGAREHAAWSQPADRIRSACCRTRHTQRQSPFRVRPPARARTER